MNITVYLGANKGKDPSLSRAVRELGTWIGESGNALVYGGSRSGLMGELAQSVLAAGGAVTGVEPEFFVASEYQYDEITELIVTKNMAERKAKMIELGDAFLAFPGGTGTLEEIAEVMSAVSLGHLDAPCIRKIRRRPGQLPGLPTETAHADRRYRDDGDSCYIAAIQLLFRSQNGLKQRRMSGWKTKVMKN